MVDQEEERRKEVSFAQRRRQYLPRLDLELDLRRLIRNTLSLIQFCSYCVAAKAHSSLQQLIDENFDQEEAKFFSASDAELERILEFYEQREKEMKDRFTVLARQLKEVSICLSSLKGWNLREH